MRIIQFSEYGPASVMKVAEADDPHPGEGEIRVAVKASGVSPGEVRLRSGELRGLMDVPFPMRTGFDAAGIVDEIGSGVTDVAIGDEVFGMADFAVRGANADFAVLAAWAPKPASWSWAEAAGAAGAVETAARVLDILRVTSGQTVLVHGAAGGTGSVLVQVAIARGATVIGTASETNHDFLRNLGVIPTTYEPGLIDRVRSLALARPVADAGTDAGAGAGAGTGAGVGAGTDAHAGAGRRAGGGVDAVADRREDAVVDAVIDCVGGSLADLVAIAGDPARVVTIADLDAASHGVRMTNGATDPLAFHGLAVAVTLADQGKLRIPVAAVFDFGDVASAHRLVETRHANGKVVLVN